MKYLAISFLILVLGFLGIFNPLRRAVHFIFNPIQFGFTRIASNTRDVASFFTNINSVHDQNLQLSAENEALRDTIVALKKLEDENKTLKDQLNVKVSEGFKQNIVMASVMGNSEDLSGTTVVIDKGSVQGLQVGNNVIKGGYLVGVVKEVFNNRSLVELITSPGVSIAVYDLDVPGRTEGIAVGQYGTSMEMKRILPDESINVGDTIMTSGKEGIYAPGLIVGKVNEVRQVPVEPLKSAFLETVIELGKITRVFVLVTN